MPVIWARTPKNRQEEVDVHSYAPRDAVRLEWIHREASDILTQHRILIQGGHFDFGNGFHGTEHLNPHELFKQPYVILQLARLLVERASPSLRRADIVAGPFTRGALLAHTVAGFLDSYMDTGGPIRPLADPPKMFVPIRYDGDEGV